MDVSDRLRQNLREWLGPKMLSTHFLSLRDKVVEPSVQLLLTISCSSKQKEFTLPQCPYRAGYFPMSTTDNEFINIASWRVVNPDRLQNCLTVLYPGIVRKGTSSRADFMLVRPVLLGYPSGAPQPSASPLSAPSPKTASEPRRYDKRRPERDTREHSPRRQSPQKESLSRRTAGEPRTEKQKPPGMLQALSRYICNDQSPSLSRASPGGQARPNTFPQREHEHVGHRAGSSANNPGGHGSSQGERSSRYATDSTAYPRATIEPAEEHGYDTSGSRASYQYDQVQQWNSPHQE
jgi:hypothetical protein